MGVGMSFNGPSHKGKFKPGDRVVSRHGDQHGTFKSFGQGNGAFGEIVIAFDGTKKLTRIELGPDDEIGDHIVKEST